MPSIPATQHAYAYGLNNPLRYVDPKGLQGSGLHGDPEGEFELGLVAQLAYNAFWWAPLVGMPELQEPFAPREDESFATKVGRHAGNAASIVGGIAGVQGGQAIVDYGVGLAGGGLVAALASGGSLTEGAVVAVVGGVVVVVVGGVVVIVAGGAAVNAVVGEVGMVRTAFSAKKGSGSCAGYGDAPDPQRLVKLKDSEVRKYGLHQEKQKLGLSPKTELYKDPWTGDIYSRESGGPFQWVDHVPELKTKQ